MKTKNILFTVLLALYFVGCKKAPENMDVLQMNDVVVETTITTAAIEVEYNFPSAIKKVTVHYSENADMIDKKTVSAVISDYSFSAKLTGLKGETQYYYYFEYDNGMGTKKTEIKCFNTLGYSYNGYEFVDLGLSSGLKWATCNVGASSPEEYGNYYAWGEIETKSSYEQNNSVTNGQQIDDFSGNPQYDAARANWGGTWRMPTRAEFEELIDECTWTWATQEGNYGYKVTGPNGNHIFLPAAGYWNGASLFNAGERGYYWSSTPNDSNTKLACHLNFYSGYHGTRWSSRSYGQSVRPVSE